MARKTLADVEQYIAIAEFNAETAMEILESQDEETMAVIASVAEQIENFQGGKVMISGRQVSVDSDIAAAVCISLAVEIFKGLAFSDIKVAEFEHPANVCASCGSIVKVKRG